MAGGQPYGLGIHENLIKECAEEAAIPEQLAAQARATGTVSYVMEWEAGLRDDVLYVFDLELPADFTPRNTDGEIEEFMLWPVGAGAAGDRDDRQLQIQREPGADRFPDPSRLHRHRSGRTI